MIRELKVMKRTIMEKSEKMYIKCVKADTTTDHPSRTNVSATKNSDVAFASRMEWQRISVAGCHCPADCCCWCGDWRCLGNRGGVTLLMVKDEVNLMTMESPISLAVYTREPARSRHELRVTKAGNVQPAFGQPKVSVPKHTCLLLSLNYVLY